MIFETTTSTRKSLFIYIKIKQEDIMKPSERKNKKWRKKSPMIHRSFAIKRGRDVKESEKEMKDYKK